MPTATITSKGQVTIPKAIRDRLGLDAGDRLQFELTEDGGVLVRPADTGGERGSLAGFLDGRVHGDHPVTVQEMKRAAHAAAAEHVLSSLRDDADDEAA